MLMCIFFIKISLVYAEFKCDYYQIWNQEVEKPSIFVISDHYMPPTHIMKKMQSNISCPCTDIPCLRKCCLLDDTFTLNKQCRISDSSGDSNLMKMKNILKYSSSNFSIVYGSNCNSVIKPLSEFSKIEINGIVTSEGLPLSVEDYCIEYFSDVKEFRIMQCLLNYTTLPIPKIYTICLICSAFCLFLTFVIYCCTQNLHGLHGKILLCYIASLFITDIFYILLQTLLISEGAFCLLSAHIIQFSFLSCFFWLNAMCFDLWWTFRGYRPFNCSSKDGDRKKFVIYCFYAWGCPAVIALVTWIIDNSDVPHEFKPKLGKNSCWFGDDFALFCYFYSFISVILAINFVMFINITMIIIRHNKSQRKFLKNDDSSCHRDNEKKRFNVYLKLFSIMGINWSMEVFSYYYQQSGLIWTIMDLCNTLQGTMIFVIFVCKRRVIILLNKKIYPKKMLVKENSRTSGFFSGACNGGNVGRGNVKSIEKTEMGIVQPSSVGQQI